ncbi:MAG: hypothetical protein K2X87_25730 [Gemmataceae bacterium]|nr:hypothetical protein [Gemmataceae bacterium]
MWPPDAELLTAWQRLLADPDTAGAFAIAVLRPLEADLADRFRSDHPDDLAAAADTAVAALVRRPDRYDPARLPVRAYLLMAARRDLLNLRDRERRHHRGRIPWAAVELDPPAGNDEGEDDPPGFDSPALAAAIEELSAVERQGLDLMRAGVKDTPAFARLLGMADRPAGEQAAEVKRLKDRIMARLKRAGRRT